MDFPRKNKNSYADRLGIAIQICVEIWWIDWIKKNEEEIEIYRIGGVAGKSPERRWRERYPKKWRRWTLSLSSLLYSLWVANCKKETLLGSVQFFAIGAGIRWVRSISRCVTQIPISTFIYFSFLLDNSYTCAISPQKSPTKALLHKLYLVRAYSLTLYC